MGEGRKIINYFSDIERKEKACGIQNGTFPGT